MKRQNYKIHITALHSVDVRPAKRNQWKPAAHKLRPYEHFLNRKLKQEFPWK